MLAYAEVAQRPSDLSAQASVEVPEDLKLESPRKSELSDHIPDGMKGKVLNIIQTQEPYEEQLEIPESGKVDELTEEDEGESA